MTEKLDRTNQTSPPAAEDKDLSRRDFLALASATLAAAASAAYISAANKSYSSTRNSEGVTEGKYRWGMLVDINKCIGCNYCTYACQATNNLPDDMEYNVVTTETTQNGTEYFLSRPCLHCEHPPCVHVCPVEATYLRDDGIVTMDYDRCIGCRYCQIACPYDVRVFNWTDFTGNSSRIPAFGVAEVAPRPRGVMEKCTFCQHRIDPALERGMMPGVDALATPACVTACPTGARVFGNLNDEHSPISEELAKAPTYIRLREELSTSPKVFYIPPREA